MDQGKACKHGVQAWRQTQGDTPASKYVEHATDTAAAAAA